VEVVVMRYLILVLIFSFSCKNANTGEGKQEGARIGAEDALAKRDTDFRKQECYCSFLLDDSEREPFTQRDSVTSKKSATCKFNTGTDGREKHVLDKLSVDVFSGAQSQQYNTRLALLLDGIAEHKSRYDLSLTKGSRDDLKIELRIVRLESGRYEKRTLAYDNYNGRMFWVVERSLEAKDQDDMSQIFDSVDMRYIDELFLNYQSACESSLDL
jgi:hypothetical protein